MRELKLAQLCSAKLLLYMSLISDILYFFCLKLARHYLNFVLGTAEKFGLEIGDHAIAENIVPCWECRYCKRGRYNMCKLAYHGTSAIESKN